MFEIGNSLSEARSRQGLDLAQLEIDTRIRGKYLRALEDEQFDLLPGDAYVRGFLRVYAEQLGLDSRLYVDEYNARFASDDELTPSRVQRPKGSRRLSLESHAVIMAVVGIIAVTVLVIAAWQVGSPGSGSAPTVETVGPPPPASESAPQPVPIEPTPAPCRASAAASTGTGCPFGRGARAGGQRASQAGSDRGRRSLANSCS